MMAWSWSYSSEGMGNIYAQIHSQDREWLEVCFAENEAAVSQEYSEPEFNEDLYLAALKLARTLPDDVLADAIWEHASEIATCANGAREAYCCPWGCHTVTPDPVESEVPQ